MLWIRGLSTVAVLLVQVTLSAGEDSCPAGAGARCNAASTSSRAGVASMEKRAKRMEAPSADLITQEVQELTAMKQLALDRMELLRELKATLNSGHNVSLPEKYLRMLKEPLPLMSEILTRSGKEAASPADDYLHTKAVIPFADPVSLLKFLPLKSRSSGPTVLLITVSAEGSARLFTIAGELIHSFSLGHEQPVTHLVANMGASQSNEDAFITTADAGGTIRVHSIDVRSRRAAKEGKQGKKGGADPNVEKASQYLSSSLNVTTKITVEMQVPTDSNGEPAVITALAVASQQGVRHFAAGDAEGKVSVFSRNGTFVASLDAALTPGVKVEALYPQLSVIFFHAESEWGFIYLDKMDVQHLVCPDFEGRRVTAAAVDSQKTSRILVADDQGEVWVFNIGGKDKKQCKVEHRFAKGTTLPSVELASTQSNFALALERQGTDAAYVSALSTKGTGRKGHADASSAVMWRRPMSAVRDWAVQKRYQQGEFLAFLSQDGLEVEVLEILNMQVRESPVDNSFGDFNSPVMIVAVVLVLGYQYVKQKGKFSGGDKKGGGEGGGGGKIDWDSDEIAKMREKIKAKKAADKATPS